MLEVINSQQQDTKINSFSIVIPTSAHRLELIPRLIRSLLGQTYPQEAFEVLFVIDGGRESEQNEMEEEILSYNDPRLKVVTKHNGRYERCISRNEGWKAAQNDWICNLDSDDEYMSSYLDRMNYYINEYPDYKMFNFGAIVCREGGQTFREPVDLRKGMSFDDIYGKIGMGSFIFKRELFDIVGYLPDVMNCYALAEAAEIPGYNSRERTLGNPWGEDSFLCFKLTREVESKKVPYYGYINYIRRQYNAVFYPTNKK